MRATDGFEDYLNDMCVEYNVLHEYRDFYRFGRNFEGIEFIVRDCMINNSNYDLAEEVNHLFWPYSRPLSIEERTQFDSTYNMIARPLFWIALCWDVKSAVKFFRRAFLDTGVANHQTTVQNSDGGHFTVLELFNEIITETTNLEQFIVGNIRTLNRWSPAQDFGEAVHLW